MSFDGGAPPKKGMGTGLKVILILGGVALLVGVICCGGFLYIGSTAVPTMSQKPADVVASTQEVLPDASVDETKFEPTQSMKQEVKVPFMGTVMKMTMGTWKAKEGEGALMFMSVELMQDNPQSGQQANQMKGTFSAQAGSIDLQNKTSETAKWMIAGAEREVTLSKGEDSAGKKYQEVSFEYKDGKKTVIFAGQFEEEAYNEAEVKKMLGAS